MIVYATRLDLTAADPRTPIGHALCDWLSRKTRADLTSDVLRTGSHALGNGHQLQVEVSDGDAGWSFSCRYSHPDADLRGRTWHTELGAKSHAGRSFCTVLLHTEEQSALVHARPDTTRPWLVQGIERACELHRDTPGGRVKTLALEDASAFLSVVDDPSRSHPIVQISHDRDGSLLLDPRRMAEHCLGIAVVCVIPADVDTFGLARAVGRDLAPFHGAVNLVWPAVRRGAGTFVPTTRLLAEDLRDFGARGLSPERECLARICHYTNPWLARGHVSLERVRAERLQRALEAARADRGTAADPELAALVQQVDQEQRMRIDELALRVSALERDLKAAEEERDEAQRKAAALEQHLAARPASAAEVPEALRASIVNLAAGAVSLEDALTLLAHLFPDRLHVLPSAWQSARQAQGFQRAGKAFELLHALCTGYWEAMRAGEGDKAAGQVFGPNSFAARESETVEGNKRARSLRTFVYQGRPVEMVRHLKIGVKDSVAETFRAHFHWDAAAQKVVLGHCGRHLDHG